MRDEPDRPGQAADPAGVSPPEPGTGATTRRGRWAGLRRMLWQPPRPHGEQPRERVVGPLELFYDLATVVLVAQAARHLAGHLTWHGLGEFAAVFTLVWIAWINGSLHHELHGRDDARARSTFLLQILVLVAMGARIPAWGLLDAAYLAGFAAVLLVATPAQATAVLATDALIERFGLLAIIVLGETLTGVVAGLAREPVSGLTLAVGLVAVVVGFGAWWTYFDFAGNRQPRPKPAASLQWMLNHLPLTAAIAAMGAAMVSLVDHAHDGRTPAATAWLLCAGAAVVLCATMLVAASLQAWHRDRVLYRPLARTCAAVAVACLGLGAARPAPLLLGLALVLLLSIPWMLAVAYRLTNRADPPTG
jgi:low temperature requirement protein LtrA